MKYSIRGELSITDEEFVIDILNKYTLWKLNALKMKKDLFDITDGYKEVFTFEVWVNTLEDKDAMFNELKYLVDEYGELIDWHECTHDEIEPKPCVIAEEYRGV